MRQSDGGAGASPSKTLPRVLEVSEEDGFVSEGEHAEEAAETSRVQEGSEEEGFIREGRHAEQSAGLPRVPEGSEEEGFVSEGARDGAVSEQESVEIEARSTGTAVEAERFREGRTGGGEMTAMSPAIEAGLETTGDTVSEAAVDARLEATGRGEDEGIIDGLATAAATAATVIEVMAADVVKDSAREEDISRSSTVVPLAAAMGPLAVAGGDEGEGD